MRIIIVNLFKNKIYKTHPLNYLELILKLMIKLGSDFFFYCFESPIKQTRDGGSRLSYWA